MTDSTSTQNSVTPASAAPQTSSSPLRCISGGIVAGGIAAVLYLLTTSIAQAFATKPIHSNNVLVLKITVVVRTMVVGMSTLATIVCGFIAIGLFALGVQLFIQQMQSHKAGNN